MSKLLTKSLKAEMVRIVGYQLAIIVGLTLIVFLLKGMADGLAVLGGAFAYWMPTCIFVLGVSVYSGARASLRFLAAFFIGESIKLVTAGLLFLAGTVFFHLDLFYALCGLVVAILAFWVSSFVSLWNGGSKTWQ